MALRAACCTTSAFAAWLFRNHATAVSLTAYVIAYGTGSWDLARVVFEDLCEARFNTEFLMLLVAAGAAGLGAWGEGSLLLVLFSSSRAMEVYAAGRTRREIDSLLKGAPKSARQLRAGTVPGEDVESEVPVEALQPGDRLRVTAGEQVPVDIEILKGQSACDESTLTGESEPVSKAPGDSALAGTLNLWGVIEGRVLRGAGDSALQRIIRLIHEAQQQKAPTQRFTDRFGTRYTAGVLLACVVVFLVNWLGLGAPPWVSKPGQASAVYRAMTLLVVLSPCALVLSVPSAILSAIAHGARRGVLFRGGAAVERLAEVGVVAMDKTGTLTEGMLRVAAVEVLEGDETSLLTAAGSLARLSNHPISRAIFREASRRGLSLPDPGPTETIAGQGIRTAPQERPELGLALGNRHLLETHLSPQRIAALPAPPEQANETWLAGPGLLGRVLLRDQLRAESRGLVDQLRAAGLRTIMLTGDRSGPAERMAREAGVDEVRSGLKPADKVAAVQALRQQGACVAMIGDGVNDAPVLAMADVGLAMGARGSDAALEQADVVLMNDRLELFVFARDLSLRARTIIRQNLVLSLGTMACMAVATLTLPGMPLWIGVAAHEGSTVVVVMNSLRLLFPVRTQPA
jgi:Cd2+/Zn2+-exporting ATPase